MDITNGNAKREVIFIEEEGVVFMATSGEGEVFMGITSNHTPCTPKGTKEGVLLMINFMERFSRALGNRGILTGISSSLVGGRGKVTSL